MSEYRIEKLRCPVMVTMMGGERIAGELFVSSMIPYRLGPEEPADVLNGPDAFVPLATADGEIILLSKQRILEVETGTPSDEQQPLDALRPIAIEIVVTGLPARSGFVHLAVRNERPRLLDYLNELHERFVSLYSLDGVRLINRAHIERVRPLD